MVSNGTDVIVALDCQSRDESDRLVADLGDGPQWFKIGIQTLVATGSDVVHDLVSARKSVFLDLKLHEIPNSVAAAVSAAGEAGAAMVSVHASGGAAVLDAAVQAADPYPDLQVVALTVITSLVDDDLPPLGIDGPVAKQVDRLATLARESGCDGVVCSVYEAASMRSLWGKDGLVVTPGVHLDGDESPDEPSDQARVGTPEHARRSGASHVVLGRAITQATNVRASFDAARRRFVG